MSTEEREGEDDLGGRSDVQERNPHLMNSCRLIKGTSISCRSQKGRIDQEDYIVLFDIIWPCIGCNLLSH